MGIWKLWAGYDPRGELLDVHLDPGSKMVAVGEGAAHLAAALSVSALESGMRPLMLDLDGGMQAKLAGRLRTWDANALLADALAITDGVEDLHGELMASAYATVYNLPRHQEALLGAALRQVSAEGGVGGPTALSMMMGAVTGFRSTDKQDVEGKVAALSLLDRVGEEGVVEQVAAGAGLVEFSALPTRALAEAACLVFLAKLLVAKEQPDLIVVSLAERIFRDERSIEHSSRLRETLLRSPVPVLFSSEASDVLDRRIVTAASLRVLSSSVWNRTGRGRMLKGTFVLQRPSDGFSVTFVPRSFEARRGVTQRTASRRVADAGLTKLILTMLAEGFKATRASLAQTLSDRASPWAVGAEVDRLLSELAIVHVRESPDSPRLDLVITQVGMKTLEELKADE